jgi:hypothetical protein
MLFSKRLKNSIESEGKKNVEGLKKSLKLVKNQENSC